jgi:hypothetical protein
MAYLKPKPFVKHVFNPMAKRFGISGAHTLAVKRRQTGETQEIPVIPAEHEGSRYIVSTRGESDWVRNMRAAGGCEIDGEPFTATELPPEEREPVIAAYRQTAGKMVDGYWKKLPDAKDHPVFRIDPAGG